MTAPAPRYRPMLAGTAPAPFSDDNWLFEIKWDGVRAIATVGTSVSLRSRNDTELAGQFPELAELMTLAPGTVLDGEIVVMSRGKPDMQALLPRLQESPPRTGAAPVTYIVFDILRRGDEDLTSLPLVKRRKILQSAVREGPHVVISAPVEGRGEDYYRAAVAQGLEGVMAKRKDSPYEPGVRSGAWLKIRAQQELRLRHCRLHGGKGRPQPGVRGPPAGAVREGEAGPGRQGRDRFFRPAARGTDGEICTAGEHRPAVSRHPREGGLAGARPCLRGGVHGGDPGPETADPRFIRLRTDKPAAACTIDQLAGTKPYRGAAVTVAGGAPAPEVKPD